MLRTLAATAVIALSCVGAAHAANQTLYLKNNSSFVSDADLANALPAFQANVTLDLNRWWRVDAQLVVTHAPPRGAWVMTIEDDSTECDLSGCALGYHDLTRSGIPYGRVFARTSDSYGEKWQVTFSHELEELLVDPFINYALLARSRWWLVEVSDPVEEYSYNRAGADGTPIPLSDFVTPAWYRPGAKGPFDLGRHTSSPLQLTPGGYVSYQTAGGWQQIFQ